MCSRAVALLGLLVACQPADPGSRGTAPSVQLLRPNAGEALSGSAEIAWVASDPDPGDTVTIDLELIEVATNGSGKLVGSIATGLPSVPSSYTWDVSTVPATRGEQPLWYRVRAVARDMGGLNERSDESDLPFSIAAPAHVTSYTWTDVQPVFLTYCRTCHGQPATPPAPESFRLDKYDASDPVPPENADLGVYEMRSPVYQRMAVPQPTMPPAYAAQPSAAEITMIADWIQGGAPR
jgi:hypothetical protein